jgi:hypothetical protein
MSENTFIKNKASTPPNRFLLGSKSI